MPNSLLKNKDGLGVTKHVLMLARNAQHEVCKRVGAVIRTTAESVYRSVTGQESILDQNAKLEEQNAELRKLVSQDGLEAVLDEIAELKDQNAELRKLASQDGLTGLDTRREGLKKFDATIEHSRSNGTPPLAVIVLDIDFFKQVNDQHTHAVGDGVLKLVAQIIEEHTRIYDVRARLGGEEFLVVIEAKDLSTAKKKAEELRSAIEEAVYALSNNKLLKVTASFGVALWSPTTSESSAEVIQRADNALVHIAKKTGKNCVCEAKPYIAPIGIETTLQAVKPGLARRFGDRVKGFRKQY